MYIIFEMNSNYSTPINTKCFIYVLSLENSKIYVGKTRSPIPEYRILDHFEKEGSAWTRLHPPIKIEQIIYNCDDFDEDKYTKEYMCKYGIDNVRGGSYCQIELDEDTKRQLTREIRNATDVCIKCGRKGHFMNQCFAKKDVDGNPITEPERVERVERIERVEMSERKQEGFFGVVRNLIDSFIEASNYGSLEDENRERREVTCYRCGRRGHISPQCYAKTHSNGRRL